MAENLYKVLHYYDIISCNHGGQVELISTVLERRTEVEDDLKVVTDQDLYHRVTIFGCSLNCKHIVSIQQGLARDLVLKDDAIPILGNLSATTDKGCTVTWGSSLAAQLAVAEGRKPHKYIDSKGHPTVGIGFNLDKSSARSQMAGLGINYNAVRAGTQDLTDPQIDALFNEDTATAQASVKQSVPGFDSLSDTRQKALTDMVFNLGSLSGWPNFTKEINAGDFEAAAKNASGSLWVTQVGNRARRIIAQLRGDEVYATPQ